VVVVDGGTEKCVPMFKAGKGSNRAVFLWEVLATPKHERVTQLACFGTYPEHSMMESRTSFFFLLVAAPAQQKERDRTFHATPW